MHVLFVHGTTVRLAGAEISVDQIEKGLKEAGVVATVDKFVYGESSAKMRFNGATIPGGVNYLKVAKAGLAGPRQPLPSVEDVLWDDPLAELRFYRSDRPFTNLPDYPVRKKQILGVAALVTTGLHTSGLDTKIPDDTLQEILEVTLNTADQIDLDVIWSSLADLIDKAIAFWLAAESRKEGGAITPQQFMPIVKAATDIKLRGQKAGGRSLKLALLEGLTWFGKFSRGGFMPPIASFMGDILTYVTNRDFYLEGLHAEFIKQKAALSNPDGRPEQIVLLGHSLGGILAFDYMCTKKPPGVILVTVGTQVGLLAEANCLALKFPDDGAPAEGETLEPTPDRRFKPSHNFAWLNLFDLNDLLSFLAEPVFANAKDKPVDNGLPFPDAHSGYFKNKEVFREIKEFVTPK